MHDLMIRKEVIDFLAVIKEGNFSKASEYLGVKQSSVSKNIMKLESNLGYKLFIRGPKITRLTEAGEIFFKNSKKAQTLWKDTVSELKNLDSKLSGKFIISCHPVIGNFFLPKLFKEIIDKTDIQLEVQFITSKNAIESVREASVDFCLSVEPIRYPDLVIRKLWSEFAGLYSKDGSIHKNIFYNSEMIGINKKLANFKNSNFIAIDDYHALYSVLKRTPNSMGILPSPIASKEKKLKLIEKASKSLSVCFAYRSDRLKTASFLYVVESIKKIKLELVDI